MGRRIQLRDLISDRLLREIHHFLWIEPSFAGDVVDAGWNCRDHAWLTALLAQSLGYKAALFHGEAFFVKARTKSSGSLSYYQRPHSWVVVEGVGAIDLSIKPDFSSSGDNFQIPVKCIFANECIPRGKSRAFFFDQAGAFNRAAERPGYFDNQNRPTRTVRPGPKYFLRGFVEGRARDGQALLVWRAMQTPLDILPGAWNYLCSIVCAAGLPPLWATSDAAAIITAAPASNIEILNAILMFRMNALSGIIGHLALSTDPERAVESCSHKRKANVTRGI